MNRSIFIVLASGEDANKPTPTHVSMRRSEQDRNKSVYIWTTRLTWSFFSEKMSYITIKNRLRGLICTA